MTLEEFKASLSDDRPPGSAHVALHALWYEAKGRWKTAHEIVQRSNDGASAWVHAYLHRRERDLTNAAYWYRRVGRSAPQMPLDDEWQCIVEALLPAQK